MNSEPSPLPAPVPLQDAPIAWLLFRPDGTPLTVTLGPPWHTADTGPDGLTDADRASGWTSRPLGFVDDLARAAEVGAFGWRLVPYEPTFDMIEAGQAAAEAGHQLAGTFRAMVGARPACLPGEASAPPAGATVSEAEDGTERLCRALYGRRPTARDYIGGSNARMLHDAADRLKTASRPEVCSPPPDARRAEIEAAARDVLAERRRQVEVEGWTPEHDDRHRLDDLAIAASVYAIPQEHPGWQWWAKQWPWNWAWLKLGDRRRNLVKAGALILAEIERLDREAIRALGPRP